MALFVACAGVEGDQQQEWDADAQVEDELAETESELKILKVRYDRAAAESYARMYALQPNPRYEKQDNDCTNFASQALHAGGWPVISDGLDPTNAALWSPGLISVGEDVLAMTHTWGLAASLYEFVRTPICDVARAEVLAEAEGIDDVPHDQLKVWGLEPGDLLFFDQHDSGVIDHAAIITKKVLDSSGRIDLLYSQHSSDKKDESLRNMLRKPPGPWRLYPVHVKDQFTTCSPATSLPAGSYQRSCTGCEATNLWQANQLRCQGCLTSRGTRNATMLQLSCPHDIANCDGTLTCGSCPSLPSASGTPRPSATPGTSQTVIPQGPPQTQTQCKLNGTLRRGASGDDVRQAQGRLRSLGYAVDVDGAYGPMTEAVVRQYQRDTGLQADGVLGPKTAAVLCASGAATAPSEPRANDRESRTPTASTCQFPRTLKRGASGDDVRLAQASLQRLGYVCDVDGEFGSKTQAIVVQFQRNNGLADDGIIGPRTGETLCKAAAAAPLREPNANQREGR